MKEVKEPTVEKVKDPVQEFEEWVFDPNREDADIPPIFAYDKDMVEKLHKENDKLTFMLSLVIASIIAIGIIAGYIIFK